MRMTIALSGVLFGAALLAGCANKETPARSAVASVDTNLAQVKDDAARYAPDALAAVQPKVDKLHAELDGHKYMQVLAQAQSVNAEVIGLRDVVVSAQTQQAAAARQWNELKDEVPKLIASIETRVNGLKGERRKSAKTSLESMKSLWAEANTAFEAGKTNEAADKAREAQAKGKELSEQLGVSPA